MFYFLCLPVQKPRKMSFDDVNLTVLMKVCGNTLVHDLAGIITIIPLAAYLVFVFF